ncbi:MAG: hypothetical protein PHY73_07730 [Candidatus Omnitrophica bacterium]|nr:hypothetical protein [Candidatus Omnitrophota bacterium]
MKRKTIFFLFIFLAELAMPHSFLQASEFFELTVAQTKNPFKSSLPKIEEMVEKIPEPTNINIEKPERKAQPRAVDLKDAEKKVKPIIKAPELIVSGLIWNTKLPQAIINQNVVTVGDTIESSKIVNIHKDGVDVLFSGITFTIKIDQTLTQSI